LSVLHSPETFGVKLETINDKYKWFFLVDLYFKNNSSSE
jgi:hypothetical protein